MKTALALVLSLFALVSAHAQSVTPVASDTPTPSSPTPVPAPPRNIMPVGLNHKPNATQPPADIAKSIDLFFKTLHIENGAAIPDTNSYAKAYEAFFNNTRLGEQKEKMSIFISKTQEAFGIYGPLKDYEIFDNYSIGSNVLVLTYLTRHSMQPLRWRFVYYRADKSWMLINMGFDDVLLDMLD